MHCRHKEKDVMIQISMKIVPNGPIDNKGNSLPDPMLSQFYVEMGHHQATMS